MCFGSYIGGLGFLGLPGGRRFCCGGLAGLDNSCFAGVCSLCAFSGANKRCRGMGVGLSAFSPCFGRSNSIARALSSNDARAFT